MTKGSYRSVLVVGAFWLGSVIAVGTVAAPAAAGAAAPVAAPADRPALAPVPLPGPSAVTQAVDISPAGVVVGTSQALPATGGGMQPPPPASGLRWLPRRGGYVEQPLAVPAGTTSVSVAGVTDLGEAGGTLSTPAGPEAVRWSVSGLRTISLGSAAGGPTTPNTITTTSAVGPGQWAVSTGDSISGSTALVARDGTRTELSGTPDLDGARILAAYSIGGPSTALVGTISGVGYGSTGHTVVWRAGATVTLPVVSSFALGNTCASEIQPDGSVAYSGPVGSTSQGPTFGIGLHRGGVPGAEVPLPTGGRTATVGCPSTDTLAADGLVVGQLLPAGSQPGEAALWRGTTLVPLGVRAGELSTTAAAVATRGRVVLVATTSTGADVPYLWSGGIRTPLALPAGWTLRNVVEMTDAGVVLANVRDAAGDVRPVVWFTGT